MPNKKISELTTVASPLSADYIPLVEDGVTKKATLASLPISDAEVTALALKAPLASPTFTGTQTMPSVAITGGTIAGITDLAVADGGTGASTAATARTNLGVAYGPAFSAYQSTPQAVPTATDEKVLLQTELFDTNSCFASSRFTPNVEGYYHFSGAVGFASSPADNQCMLAKNGVTQAVGVQAVAPSLVYITEVNALVYMNGTTDYVELMTRQTSGAPQDTTALQAITRLSGYLARPA
jgi:hypothetical protein